MGALLLPSFANPFSNWINSVWWQFSFSFRPSRQSCLVGCRSGFVGETFHRPWCSLAQGNRFVAQFGDRCIVCDGKSSATLLAKISRN